MLVPDTDRLALGEHPITRPSVVRAASQGNNRTGNQRVPGSPRSDSVFATSEFLQLTAESVIDDQITDSELSTL
jgi:hypothetical protein